MLSTGDWVQWPSYLPQVLKIAAACPYGTAHDLRRPIDTRDLRAGVHYLRVEEAGIVVTKRFVIDRYRH